MQQTADKQDHSTLQQTADKQDHSILQQTDVDKQDHSSLQQTDENYQPTEQDTEDKSIKPTEINENCNNEQSECITTDDILETKESIFGLFNGKNIVIAIAGVALAGLGLAAFFRK